MTTTTLTILEKAERAAWQRLMRGSAADACTLPGQEGINELAWRKAADALRTYRTVQS